MKKNNLNKYLHEINQSSLMSIHFFKQPIDQFVKQLDFMNLVIAGDGLYTCLTTKFGYIFDKIKTIKYNNSNFDNLENDLLIYTYCEQRPDLAVFNKMLEMCKYVCNKSKNELMINLYYHIKTKEYIIELADQTIGKASVNYNYSKKYEMSGEYIRYLQLHSHNTMGANFSNIDDVDEKTASLCFYGVIGKINKNSKFYDVDKKFRIWTGTKFVDIQFDQVFNLEFSNVQLEEHQIQKLDQIIANSNEKLEKKYSKLDDIYTLIDRRSDYYYGDLYE